MTLQIGVASWQRQRQVARIEQRQNSHSTDRCAGALFIFKRKRKSQPPNGQQQEIDRFSRVPGDHNKMINTLW